MATITDRVRGAWEYYRRYTLRRTGVHAGATAALTVLGLLAYYERWFALVAIVAYLLPPVYLYLTGDDLSEPEPQPTNPEPATAPNDHASSTTGVVRDADVDFDGADADFDGADADSDGYDADFDGADADFDGIDRDFDGHDADSDGDTDSDGDDGDTDGDSDGD
ncbi:hypothetical protein C447_04347 [Halococcus hamelinensis 100A6]|uniref:Uncharacterized protein n=1 Tax=Halococcus hamelinensis 100A6 TaxID=1132509 RepID=M0M7D2_9EURY|nr:hypothetical protein C447_04347 [Halococcus hamelinensis 100A6]